MTLFDAAPYLHDVLDALSEILVQLLLARRGHAAHHTRHTEIFISISMTSHLYMYVQGVRKIMHDFFILIVFIVFSEVCPTGTQLWLVYYISRRVQTIIINKNFRHIHKKASQPA